MDILFKSDEFNSFLFTIKSYKNINVSIDINKYIGHFTNGIRIKLYFYNRKVYDEELEKDINNFIIHKDNCETLIQKFIKTYDIILGLVNRINSCKNNFWKAEFSFDYNGYPVIEIDQTYFTPKRWLTLEKIRIEEYYTLSEIINSLETGMHKVLKNMEQCGYRVMGVID